MHDRTVFCLVHRPVLFFHMLINGPLHPTTCYFCACYAQLCRYTLGYTAPVIYVIGLDVAIREALVEPFHQVSRSLSLRAEHNPVSLLRDGKNLWTNPL
jgi:hypothetical protein